MSDDVLRALGRRWAATAPANDNRLSRRRAHEIAQTVLGRAPTIAECIELQTAARDEIDRRSQGGRS